MEIFVNRVAHGFAGKETNVEKTVKYVTNFFVFVAARPSSMCNYNVSRFLYPSF